MGWGHHHPSSESEADRKQRLIVEEAVRKASGSASIEARRLREEVYQYQNIVRDLRAQNVEYEARFADDCKTAARELAESSNGLVAQRGHVIVDRTMLVEHWWVQSRAKNRIIDPTFYSVRGTSRPHHQAELIYVAIDTDGCDYDFEAPYTGCMVSWGTCTLDTPCEWCTARATILVNGVQLEQPSS